MTPVSAQTDHLAPQLPQMEASEFASIADYAKITFGLHLPLAKKEMVFARLIRRLRRLGLQDFSTYLAYIKHKDNAEERSEFLSALTTNVTQFFRENHHFDFLRDKLLPDFIAKARAGHRIRIWSAGCSAGQEPYSLAMLILDSCPDAAALDIKILASDIDPRILDIARTGEYPAEQRAAIPAALHRFLKPAASPEMFAIDAGPRNLISFAELNLIEDWPMRQGFDVIFCRNVAIYFDAPTQARLWHRFSQQTTSGGHLFIGHSERLSGPAQAQMRSVGITVYVKNPSP
jgi:chemotaxis protein methyltransferase CheR